MGIVATVCIGQQHSYLATFQSGALRQAIQFWTLDNKLSLIVGCPE